MEKALGCLWDGVMLSLSWLIGLALMTAIGANSDWIIAAEDTSGMGINLLYVILAASIVISCIFLLIGNKVGDYRAWAEHLIGKAVLCLLGTLATAYLLHFRNGHMNREVLALVVGCLLVVPLRAWLYRDEPIKKLDA